MMSGGNAREPVAAASLKNNDVYPPRDGVCWSENVARQFRCRSGLAFRRVSQDEGVSILPDDAALAIRPGTVRAKHAASLIVLRGGAASAVRC